MMMMMMMMIIIIIIIIIIQSLLSSLHSPGTYILKHIKNLILLVPSYGCETWFLTLREEHRLGCS
jgi:hypothetical protein